VFDHVTLGASSFDASVGFYRTVLGAIGIEPTYEWGELVEWDDFSIMPARSGRQPTRRLHVGFVAASRAEVDRFWQAGTDAGCTDEGPPGERSYTPGYYGAFLLDPDGNSAEAVHHHDVRRGGHVDHLWIGVTDLDRAETFYRVIARQHRAAGWTALGGGRPVPRRLGDLLPGERRTAGDGGIAPGLPRSGPADR
jgi:catechol 2,3-dioxygenase-like lactoylglutathione lyase family enzyme